ncbi:MAG: DJ-1/PfpI family protein [Bacteroidetes bacterium]|nr:DJ-1/PfpI family protein [Bacteroidota bacterium]MBL0065124.1 DJ-1/PfpI family protein [Bacteroidota bacterium]MBL0138481.1 DJ-1/PfpI family protein [Bacteroidota bacterium]
MKKVVFIVPPELFRDEELLRPMEILNLEGIQTDIASTVIKTITGMKGTEINATIKISEIDPEDYDSLIVIGGTGTQTHLWNYRPLLLILKRAHEEGKLVGGICSGSVVLAHSGILAGKKATTFPAISYFTELKRSGAIYNPSGIEVVDNIITGSGPDAANEFGKAIARILNENLNKFHESVSMPLNSPFNDV